MRYIVLLFIFFINCQDTKSEKKNTTQKSVSETPTLTTKKSEKTSEKPFLAVFAGNDPVTNGAEKDVLKMAPNATSAPHIGGGHFFQWTKPKQLSKVLVDFIKE